MKFKKYIFISLLLIFIFNVNFCYAGDMKYTPEVAIPGFSGTKDVDSGLLGDYISSLYQYLLYVAGVLAVIVIMIGGFQWITAGGNQSKIGEAKERIMSAIIGLFLALASYLLLYTINPNLVEIYTLDIQNIEEIAGTGYSECDGELSYRQCDDTSTPVCNFEEGEYITYASGECECAKCISNSGVITCPPGHWEYVASGGCYNYCVVENGYPFFSTHPSLSNCCDCHY